ncbi:MAG: trypsin-like peptidase domain-containing protein [Polyangiaceae bacterium]|nr:trypsin-like peptidase domain-containing protein [Polyangiaceae bacterium]
MTSSAQPATEAAIWLAFAPGYGHFTAVAIGPRHLLTVASLTENAPYVKLMRAGEQVRTAELERVCAPEEGDLAVLRVDDELPHALELVAPDESGATQENVDVELVGYRDCLDNALEKRAVVLHWTSAKLLPDEEGLAPQLSEPLGNNEAGAPILDARHRIVGIAFQGEDLETCLVFPIKRLYELNRKWKIPVGSAAQNEIKSPTTAQSLALMHIVAAQHDEQRDGNPAERIEHYRGALRLDPQCGAAHLGVARDKSRLGELDDEVFHSLGRACELLSASEWSPQCRDRSLANLLCSSKHLHGVVTAVRADLKKNLPLAGWAALGRAIDDLVQYHYGPQGMHFASESEDGGAEMPRLPEKAAGRVLLWTGQPRSVIAIPSHDQPDILRAAAFLLVDHAEQALFWLDDPEGGENVEANRLEMTQQLVAAMRWIARCRERMYDKPLEREIAEKYASVVGKLMPGGDVLSWHANALAKVAHGDIDGGIEDLDRAIRGLSPIALPGRWSREFPGLLPTPAQLVATFGELVLAQDKPELARRALEKLPMPATDDVNAPDFTRIEGELRERCGVEPDAEVSADRALARANREHPHAVRLARTLAYFAVAPLPCQRLGDFATALPYLIKLGFMHEMNYKPWYDPTFRLRVQELCTAEQRTTALHDALEIILANYAENTSRERAELLPHILEVTRVAAEHEVDLPAVTDLLARAGNQRARELAYADARDLLERAAATAVRASASLDLRAEIDMDLGWVELASGAFVPARDYLERALRFYTELATSTNDRMPYRRMARIHYSLAKVALGTNDTDAARTHAARALEHAERGFDPGSRKAVQMYTTLTHMFIQLGDAPRVHRAHARMPGRESSLSIEA